MRHFSQSSFTIEREPRALEQEDGKSAEQSILEFIPQMVWTNSEDGRQTYYNKRWYDFTGLCPERADAVRRSELIHPDDLGQALEIWNRSLATGAPYEAQYRLRHRSGAYRWVLSRSLRQLGPDGKKTWYGSTIDIDAHVTAQTALNASEALNRSIIESSADSILMLDVCGGILFMNDAAVREFELARQTDPIGKAWAKTFPSRYRKMANRALDAALRGSIGHFRAVRPATGSALWHDVKVTPVLDESGAVASLVVISRNITAQRTIEERARWSANHDALTELPNRTLFQQRLDEVIEHSEKSGKRVGLLLLDVDHFKQINDTLGHDAGDRLLCNFAERLRRSAPCKDLIARLGGDEFAVILPQVGGVRHITLAAERILAELRDPYVHEGRVLDCRATIGASIYPQHGRQRIELMKHADVALYVAKTQGRGGTMLFKPEMRAEIQGRRAMLSLARSTVEQKLIVPFYQPKVDLTTGKVAGFEALLRWRHPQRGIQLPSTVAAAFEDLDLAAAISDRIVEQVIADVRRWLDRGLDFGHVAINAAAAEFRRGRFGEKLLEQLHAAAVPTHCVQLEVTETVFLGRGADYVEQALKLLHAEGMQIALDDFGTGYASLSHLKQFPVDVIKIDRSFIRDLEEDPDDAAIVRAVLNLGRSLNIKIVAEGVEEKAQEDFLLRHGCDYGQGFRYGKAVPARHVARLIHGPAEDGLAHLERCGNGASDGARTRDLRRDRPAL